MKIAYVVVKNILRGGGIEKYTLELGSRLVAKGHNVSVYSMRHYGHVNSEVNGMHIRPVRALKKACLQKLSASFSAVCDILVNGDYDIVHLHSVAAGALAFLPRLKGCKTVLQMHGIEWQRSRWGDSGSLVLKWLERMSLLQADFKTAVSHTQCDYFQNKYNCRMAYIPTATDIKPLCEPDALSCLGVEPGNYVLFASRLVREKGAHFLIPAFRKLDTDMKLVIAGDCQGEEKYKAELKSLAGGDPRVVFPGFVEGRLLEELFSHAYLYVQPSLIEGLSIALLEAMSYGNCCLVSDIPENMEAISNCGFVFKSGNVDNLSAKLDWLLKHKQSTMAVKKQAVDRIKEYYSWDRVTDLLETHYQELMSA